MAVRRVPAGHRVILTNEEVDRLIDRLADSKNLVDRLIVSKLLSVRPTSFTPKAETGVQ